MLILGIETSCDETAVALFGSAGESGRVLAERIASQIEQHAPYGGVVPEIASREHARLLPPMAQAVMTEAGADWRELNAIAVTAGPGLMGALLVGVSFARGAGLAHGLPVLPVHHMEGHLLAPGIEGGLPAFPFVTLLVSGGHTMLVQADGLGRYRLLGTTLDDAAGECFDKTARLLGLGYPGGPAIARLAREGDAARVPLPRPLLNRDNLDFSFSGLKTAVMHAIRGHEGDERFRADLAAAIELAVADVLSAKAVRACRREGVRALVVAGGVAANARLRAMLADRARAAGVRVHLPDPRHCTDNAAMIAHAGWLRLRAGMATPAPDDWDADPRWSVENL
ncbi:MAG: tRNA (adenosine(37)-N6)-threonylcarbamoyltransferase complex transferase subunit TsaD [Mariprofundaceae bacterium]